MAYMSLEKKYISTNLHTYTLSCISTFGVHTVRNACDIANPFSHWEMDSINIAEICHIDSQTCAKWVVASILFGNSHTGTSWNRHTQSVHTYFEPVSMANCTLWLAISTALFFAFYFLNPFSTSRSWIELLSEFKHTWMNSADWNSSIQYAQRTQTHTHILYRLSHTVCTNQVAIAISWIQFHFKVSSSHEMDWLKTCCLEHAQCEIDNGLVQLKLCSKCVLNSFFRSMKLLCTTYEHFTHTHNEFQTNSKINPL